MRCISLALLLAASTDASIPAEPRYFRNLVSHHEAGSATYPQRYYLNDTAFLGPGSPIFMIMGGEGAIPPSTGFFYPWVVDVLAPKFGALVLEPEHRFYGASLPFGADSYASDKMRLLTPEQALEDAVALLTATRQARNCSSSAGPGYCPAITFGGSYPGWMSAMMRLRYPAVVDGAYAASAPMRFYAQQLDQYAYYQVVTSSARRVSKGCPAAVLAALTLLGTASTAELTSRLGLCTPLPAYIVQGGEAMLRAELSMVFAYTFAGLNMANYPPGPQTGLAAACARFEAGGGSVAGQWASLRETLHGGGRGLFGAAHGLGPPQHPASSGQCASLQAQVPAGANGTISCGDWSGCGTGTNGRSWDYETCTLLVERIGTNGKSDMFPPRPWTLEWLGAHCEARFGVTPAPTRLVDEWGFDAEGLVRQGASRILFTNGLNDGWSAGGFLEDVDAKAELLALNMPNGAHHSDLSHSPPGPQDTPDVAAARAKATAILERWLAPSRQMEAKPTPAFLVYENADNAKGRMASLALLGTVGSAKACERACVAKLGGDPTSGCTSFTFYHSGHATAPRRCYGDTSGVWTPFYSDLGEPKAWGNVTSGQNDPASFVTPCASAAECSYNGVCTDAGVCECHPQWMGLHCGQLHLLPTEAGQGLQQRDGGGRVSSWGGSVVLSPDGSYHMWAAEMVDNCGIGVPPLPACHCMTSARDSPLPPAAHSGLDEQQPHPPRRLQARPARPLRAG